MFGPLWRRDTYANEGCHLVRGGCLIGAALIVTPNFVAFGWIWPKKALDPAT